MDELPHKNGTILFSAPKLVFGQVLTSRKRLNKAVRNGTTDRSRSSPSLAARELNAHLPFHQRTIRPRDCTPFDPRMLITAKSPGRNHIIGRNIGFISGMPAICLGSPTLPFISW